MNKIRRKPENIDEYIDGSTSEVRATLKKIRATIKRAAPKAKEAISYRMPAFFQDGALVYFAAFKKHIGFYPPVRDASLKKALAKYAGDKGNLRFPLDEPMPYRLIIKVVKARLRENRLRTAEKARKRSVASKK